VPPLSEQNHRNGKQAGIQISHEDALEECLSVFHSGLLQDISTEDLVFCEPSEDDDPLIPPPLQPLAVANNQFLEYQNWIIKLYCETSKLDCGNLERCQVIWGKLINELRDEWIRLDDLKCRAWQITFRKRTPSPSNATDLGSVQVIDTPSPSNTGPTDLGSAQVIDTGECISLI